MQLTIYTVGHSTRSLEEFVVLLRAHGIRQLVDVRTIPRSRHNPQFNRDTLATFIRNRRIGYRHMKELGGLRHARADSVNMGWHNASFCGFADYMQTPAFARLWKSLLRWPVNDRPPSCAPRRFPGAATARSSAMRSLSGGSW